MTTNMSEIVVSAPGKVILHGEHAVVYGKKALAASLNLRTFLRLVPSNASNNITRVVLPDIGIDVQWCSLELEQLLKPPVCDPLYPSPPSEALITLLKDIAKLPGDTADTKSLAVVAFLYLYSSITPQNGQLPALKMELASRLPTGAGLGSSAAFATCVASSLLLWKGYISQPCPSTTEGNIAGWTGIDLELINKWAFQAEKIIHGNPSGIDNSISTYGGALLFQKGQITPLERVPEISILLMNTHVPRSTKVLVAGVRQKYDKYPDIIAPVLDSIEAITDKCQDIFAQLVKQPSDTLSSELQQLIDMNQHHLCVLGVSQADLDTVCHICIKHGLHAKLTGAGGGGCAYALLPSGIDAACSVVQTVQKELCDLGYSCWQTTVGGHGVLQHVKLDMDNLLLPDKFRQLLCT